MHTTRETDQATQRLDQTTQQSSRASYAEENIPEELSLRQWVPWRYETRDDKRTKVPYNARTGARAAQNRAETWSTFEEALQAFQANPDRYEGVGFVFSSEDPYAGVDLDKCRDPETGELQEWAREIVEDLGGYAEVSPSGTGVHIIVRGRLPEGYRNCAKVGTSGAKIEVYDYGRYFTVTGEAIRGAGEEIPHKQDEIDALAREYLEKPQNPVEVTRSPGLRLASSGISGEKKTTEHVLEIASRAKDGPDFLRLWRGDVSGFDSWSDADLGLASRIAFYTGPDPDAVDRVFRDSALMRPKWDEVHYADGRTYGQGTCEQACVRDEFYKPGNARYAVTPLRRFPEAGSAPKFPTDALPPAAARLVKEAAAAIGCPPDPIGLAALSSLGAAIGNSRVIRPKKSWTEGAVIYAAVIADSGEKKTASIGAAVSMVRELGLKLEKAHEKKMDEYQREQREYEVEKADARKNGLAAPPPPRPPVEERVHVNDTTIEALMPILKDSPRGVLLERDELVGWANAMDQYKSGGKGAERQFWLSAWSNQAAKVDRKGQAAPLSVSRPFVSVIGSIQPEVLPEISDGRPDGMIERFLFSFPDTVNSCWTDDEISDEAEASYHGLYHKLRELKVGKGDEGQPVPSVVEFSEEAKRLFVMEYNNHRGERDLPGFPRELRSPWPKLEAYLLRITLILAACRFVEKGAPERVEVEDVENAALLMGYFKEQARRVFAALRGGDPGLRLVEDCARFVLSRGGSWEGTATELHDQLESDRKPERPDELSKFLKDASEDGLGLLYESTSERFKDENGKSKTRRVLRLSLQKTA